MLQWILFFSLVVNKIFADTECPYVSISNNNVGDRRKDKNKLRLVQYNVEWLFIDYYTNMDCPGNGCTWKTVADAQTHLNYVVNVIKEVDPDIINFCEVEGCDELNMLKEQLDGTYMPYLKKGTDTGTGQNVGLLTRLEPVINLYRTELKHNYPLNGSKCGYTGSQSSSGVSKHYITEFKFNDMDVAFISAHFIAIPTDPARCAQREAQASVLQTVISDYILKKYEVIVLGDFNDYDAEILDVNSDKPTSIVLDILKGFKGDLAGNYELHNIAEQIPQNERYSDWWDSDNNCNTSSKNDYSMIDHVLVTDAIRKNVENVFIYHGYDEYCGKYDSDHYPVIVDLIL